MRTTEIGGRVQVEGVAVRPLHGADDDGAGAVVDERGERVRRDGAVVDP